MIIRDASLPFLDGTPTRTLRLEDGKILQIEGYLEPKTGEEVIEASGLILLPAMIDLHGALGDRSLSGEALHALGRRAVNGGVGQLALMPDSSFLLDSEASLESFLGFTERLSEGRILPIASAIKGESGALGDLAILQQMGCCGIALRSDIEGNLARRVGEYAQMLQLPLFCRCEDASLRGAGVVSEGEFAFSMGLPGIPEMSETREVAKMAEMALAMGIPMLFQSLSSPRSLQILRSLKPLHNGLYAELSLHHLLLNESCYEKFNPLAKLSPPLQSEHTRQELLALLASGAVDVLTALESEQPARRKHVAFEEAASGFSSIGDFLALGYTHLIKRGVISWKRWVELTAKNPAQIIGLKDGGEIAPGGAADLILVDLKASRRIDSPLSPYHGEVVDGEIREVILGGVCQHKKRGVA